MSVCLACGTPVDENRAFCPKCGRFLKGEMSAQLAVSGSCSPKPRMILLNGVFIGTGAAALVLGLVGVFALNGSYARIVNILYHGAPPDSYRFDLGGIIPLISL